MSEGEILRVLLANTGTNPMLATAGAVRRLLEDLPPERLRLLVEDLRGLAEALDEALDEALEGAAAG